VSHLPDYQYLLGTY